MIPRGAAAEPRRRRKRSVCLLGELQLINCRNSAATQTDITRTALLPSLQLQVGNG